MGMKNVLVVGASGDIGIAITKQLAEEGYRLILHYNKNHSAFDHLKQTIAHDQLLAVIQADLTRTHDIKRFLTQLTIPVHIVIFASGAAHYGLFQDTTEATMDDMLMLHIKAPWMITKHILPSMIQRKSGKIILITSIWGTIGASYEVIYSTLKGAQNSFVKALAKEVAPSGISVNAVSPGFIETKMNDHLLSAEKESIISEIPMNRAGTVAEVAHTVLFLLNEKSNYIQGEIIHLTGGW